MVGGTDNPDIPGGDGTDAGEVIVALLIGMLGEGDNELADAFIPTTVGGKGPIETGGVKSCWFTRRRHEGVEFATNKGGTFTDPPTM